MTDEGMIEHSGMRDNGMIETFRGDGQGRSL